MIKKDINSYKKIFKDLGNYFSFVEKTDDQNYRVHNLDLSHIQFYDLNIRGINFIGTENQVLDHQDIEKIDLNNLDINLMDTSELDKDVIKEYNKDIKPPEFNLEDFKLITFNKSESKEMYNFLRGIQIIDDLIVSLKIELQKDILTLTVKDLKSGLFIKKDCISGIEIEKDKIICVSMNLERVKQIFSYFNIFNNINIYIKSDTPLIVEATSKYIDLKTLIAPRIEQEE
jgi:hypothetical protein